MPDFNRDELRAIKSFPQLVKYLRDELDWPIEAADFEEITFEYDPEELGIDPGTAAKIREIKQLRPLVSNQPWGIFFLMFEPKKLPVVVLRRILSKLVIKKRASAKTSERAVWNLHDLLFISNYGEGDQRQITFANFSQDEVVADLPTLKVLGWDYEDTELHIDNVHHELKANLRWPYDDKGIKQWRETWSSAFVLRNREVITTSKDLATRLAALAQRIRQRTKKVLELENANGPMRQLYRAFQETLIHDLKEDDFADMYAQTIAYGLLTARMSRPMGITSSNITDMVPNTNPFLRDILGTFIATGGRQGKIDFDELGVQEIVELLNSPDTHMEAVLRDFGNRTRQEDPVIHFYELFLTEYDKKKKVQRGVFYTPQPVVSYIVRSVHELLQKEFDLEDGLADVTTWGEMTMRNGSIKIPEGVSSDEPFVQILDPAVGTATFLVEVIDVIHKTMMAKWLKQGHMALEFPQLWNEYVPKHLLPRLYGYELMMAPYAIAHMRLGLKLFETGYRFGAETTRANVYLTNSLEPADEVGPHRKFEQLAPALAHEAKAVNEVKHYKQFTVIIGNPPYSGTSANNGTWIMTLLQSKLPDTSDSYFNVDGINIAERQQRWLYDDYVKFLRFGQWRLAETTLGVFGFITNHGYLTGPIFRGMRQSLLATFPYIRIVDLHGNSKRHEVSQDGSEDQNVFDIQQGVAIALYGRTPSGKSRGVDVKCSDLWGLRDRKYDWLKDNTISSVKWSTVVITKPFFNFRVQDQDTEIEYKKGWPWLSVFGFNNVGIVTARDTFTVSFSPEELWESVQIFIRTPIEKARELFCLGKDSQDWSVERAQDDCRKTGPSKSNIIPILYRPFDLRFTYYTGSSNGFHARPCPKLARHMIRVANIGLVTAREIEIARGWEHILCTAWITANHTVSLKETNYLCPLYLDFAGSNVQSTLNSNELMTIQARSTNILTQFMTAFGKRLNMRPFVSGVGDGKQSFGPEDIMCYMYAELHSLEYRHRYADFLKADFPHIFMTGNPALFFALSRLGSELVALHLMKSPRLNTPITKWQGSNTSNEVEKVTYSNQTVWIDKGQSEGFCGVPENVWNFHIGGYQVCQKWLKDRKGRVLSREDIVHYQKIVVALNETIRIMKEIDEVIDKFGGWPGAFVQDQ